MIREAVARSLGVVRVHPWVMLALGCALVLAIASTPTGLGLALFPWFACELHALALGASGVPVQPRGLAWVKAALVLLGIAVLFGAVVALAALVFGPDIANVDRAMVLPWEQALLRVAGIVAISVAALAYVLPFLYVPALLLEHGGRLGTAVLESVLLVRRGGAMRSFRLVLVAASFALLPAIVAAIITARLVDRASTPLGIILSVPLLVFSLPVGLGVVAQGHLLQRHLLPARHLVRARPLPRRAVALLSIAVISPVLGLVLLLYACALPAPLVRGELPRDATLLVEEDIAGRGVTAPGSTLSITLTPRRVEVLPAIDDAPIVLETTASRAGRRRLARVRVHAVGELYALEVFSEHRREGWALFDAAGARMDDTVHRALDERLGVARALLFGPAFLVIALLVLRALGPVAETRGGERPTDRELEAAERGTVRLGWALLPWWLLIVVLGALAVIGV